MTKNNHRTAESIPARRNRLWWRRPAQLVGRSGRPSTQFIERIKPIRAVRLRWLYSAGLGLGIPWPGVGPFAPGAIPAARSFAIRLMSFTGTGLVSGKWTVPFRSS